jgi:hypothetical protein
MNKTCSKCGQVKPLDNFSRDKNSIDGLTCLCKACYSTYYKSYRSKNRDKLCLKNRLWNEKNWKSVLVKRREYYQTIKALPTYHIKKNLRTRIWLALKNINKSKTTTKLLGCSIEKLKKHLQAQFKPGMSWENYGKWHVDHIKPCARFDLTEESEQKKCFHYTNLQPLWAEENQKKGSVDAT